MLVTHPYVDSAHVEEARMPDGTFDRILVVRSKMKRPKLDADNDNSMTELLRQLQSLDTLARNGFADFTRIEIRDTHI